MAKYLGKKTRTFIVKTYYERYHDVDYFHIIEAFNYTNKMFEDYSTQLWNKDNNKDNLEYVFKLKFNIELGYTLYGLHLCGYNTEQPILIKLKWDKDLDKINSYIKKQISIGEKNGSNLNSEYDIQKISKKCNVCSEGDRDYLVLVSTQSIKSIIVPFSWNYNGNKWRIWK